MRTFEYGHRVGFEDTSLTGSVYFANYVRWQGHCREMFLCEHAPDVAGALEGGLALLTTRTSCEFLDEAHVFDEIVVRMRLADRGQSHLGLLFEYVRRGADGTQQVIARGEQEIVSRRRQGRHWVPCALPESLQRALAEYAGAPGAAGSFAR
jgi:enediyne core biosynthesis thioesterase